MSRSFLEIYDLETGRLRTVLETDELIEAPNWFADGQALLVNGGGRLWRVPLDSPGLEPFDTGFAVNCNNDHGLSPDGTAIAISDSTEDGASCIYIVPKHGGAPRRVTERTPSYWHGWSPDGTRLAYCARRDGQFDIYTVSTGGGPELRLTCAMGHCDGPDYSADGQWIWFNCDVTGHAQLWRMRPGGGELEQMTHDARVNWFPHPSPNGRDILYLAYAPGTEGHPRGRDVALRLMPAAGGEPSTLVDLHGGQGTINVPCWGPDGGRFAYVRYAREGDRSPS